MALPACLCSPNAASSAAQGPPIAADSPDVGRFVRIDLPWSAHPFAVSDFRIDDAAQLAAVRALGAAHVRCASAQVGGHAAEGVAAPLSRHAQRVLSGLAQLRAATGASARQPAEPAAAAESGSGVRPLDPALCRRQLLEAAREAVALGARLAAPTAGHGLPTDDAASAKRRAAADAARLARALATKLSGLPSAYIRALCEDAVQADDEQPAFPRAIRVAVLAVLLARAVELDAAALRDVLADTLLHDAEADADADAHAHAHAHDAAADADADATGEPTPAACTGPAAIGPAALLGDPPPADGLPARIVSLVGRYDDWCRLAGLAPHLALARLLDGDAMPFDRPLLRAFGRLMGVYPPGSLVRLSDAGYARVVDSGRRAQRRAAQEAGADAGLATLFDDDGDAATPGVPRHPTNGSPLPRRSVAAVDSDPFAFTFVPADALSR